MVLPLSVGASYHQSDDGHPGHVVQLPSDPPDPGSVCLLPAGHRRERGPRSLCRLLDLSPATYTLWSDSGE